MIPYFNGLSTTTTPTTNEILIDVLIVSLIKLFLQEIFKLTIFNTPYLKEMVMGAPRWSYLVNILFQGGCFIACGFYAFMQYDSLDSFLNCSWDTYVLPSTRMYGIMLSSYMIRDLVNCLYSTNLLLHHVAGASVTIWAMCQPCGLELYLGGVSTLEIGSMFNNFGTLSNPKTRSTLFFINNFIFFVGHIVGMYLVYQILIGNADIYYRYFVFTATLGICIMRQKTIYEQSQEYSTGTKADGKKKD